MDKLDSVLPETANGPDAIASECIRTIAQAKGMPPSEVHEDSTLEELGLDSLDKVSLSFDLEEKYGVDIPEHRMSSVKTVGNIISEVKAAMARRTPPDETTAP